jgi:hypothetical protein
MVCEKIVMVFFKPKGMTPYLYNPNLVMTIVFLISSSAMGIY